MRPEAIPDLEMVVGAAPAQGWRRPGFCLRHGLNREWSLYYYVLRFFFKKKKFIYVRQEIERQRPRQREKQAPRGEPDAGLDPGTPGSRPGPKAALTAEPPGIPECSL